MRQILTDCTILIIFFPVPTVNDQTGEVTPSRLTPETVKYLLSVSMLTLNLFPQHNFVLNHLLDLCSTVVAIHNVSRPTTLSLCFTKRHTSHKHQNRALFYKTPQRFLKKKHQHFKNQPLFGEFVRCFRLILRYTLRAPNG